VLVLEAGRLVSDEERYLADRRTSRLTDRMYRPREVVERERRAARDAADAAAAAAPADATPGGGPPV
jgi:hypothetical protein